MKFKNYLVQLKLHSNTIAQLERNTEKYLQWLQTENMIATEARYNDILFFIQHLQQQKQTINYQNRMLVSLRHYYNYLQKKENHHSNPATGMKIQGMSRKIPHELFDAEELQQLYENYKTTDDRTSRNKMILGLLIYQAITSEELKQLEASHLKLREGKIYIPGSENRNSRVLQLQPHQIIELHEYITTIRQNILQGNIIGNYGRKPSEKIKSTEQLFISMNGSPNIKNSLLHLTKALQKINPKLRNAKHIRMSTIANWLKTNDIRKVQYMAGHKYVSSTERYQAANLEDLQQLIQQHHPLK
jgi:integrase/recombinase XerD